MQEKRKFESLIVLMLIAFMPTMMLTDIGHASGAFLALAFFCLIISFSRTGGIKQTVQDLAPYRLLALFLSVSLLVVLASSIWQQKYLASDAERGFRTFLGTIAILGGCLALIPRLLRQAIWGIIAGVWAAAGYSIWLSWPNFNRPDVPQYNAVSYGNLLLLLSVLSVFSMGWHLTLHRKVEATLKVLTFIIGIVGFLLTQTRSGWLAVPIFILIGVILFFGNLSIRKLITFTLLACTLALGVFALSSTMRDRARIAVSEAIECTTKNPLAYSSVCIRIQLWRASVHMFKANPLIGNGSTQAFPRELKLLSDQNVVSKIIVDEAYDEPHNDLLFILASYGLSGLVGLLLLYFAPAWIFFKRLKSGIPQSVRIAAAMGLAVCLGFFVFGLTELMFRGMRTMGFYAAMLGWLLALSDSRLVKNLHNS